MTLSSQLAALRDEAMRVSCQSWAIQKRWKLGRGSELAGPCPVCGGNDRFSINVRENLFNCRKCGIAGSGVIDLVMKTEEVSFVEACERITGRKAEEPVDEARAEQLRREAEADEAKRKESAAFYREKERKASHGIWQRAAAPPIGGHVGAYLAELRGLKGGRIDFSGDWSAGMRLRSIEAHPYWDEDGREKLHIGPAMIAAIQAPDEHFLGAHQTWIDLAQPKGKLVLPHDAKDKPRPAKKVRGLVKGGAIRLHTPETPRRIVMGEGIETTLTAFAHAYEPETAYWAGVALGNMTGRAARDADNHWLYDQPDMDDLDCFVPPEWCAELVFLCDTDEPENRTIEKIARGLRRAEALRPGLVGMLVEPIGDGKDLNDLVMRRELAREAAPASGATGI